MKKVLLIATGGTIASAYTQEGLAPKIAAGELLQYVDGYQKFCQVDVTQPFSLDSTNICGKHWLKLAALIEEHYTDYDGFVICHGTDTMAFTAAALSYLVQNEDRVVTKQELFEKVWEDKFTGDGTLNVHIRKLREAIEPDPGNPEHILTVWGEGYRFCGLSQKV